MHLNSGPPYPTKKNKPVTLPTREEVELVAYCVGVYLSAYSKEPFDEKWSVDGVKMSGLLLNPRSTAHFVKELFSQERPAISATSDGGEQAIVSKGLLLKHLEDTLSDPMTGFLCDTKWFTKTDIEGLHELIEVLIKSKKELFNLHMPYPLTSILDSYVEAKDAPYSVLTLGYHDDWVICPIKTGDDNLTPNINSEFKLLHITSDTNTPCNIYPRFVGRYLNVNHPGSDKLEDAAELAIKETGYYLNDTEQEILRKNIKPDAYTTFFGEVAKIPDTDMTLQGIRYSGFKYIETITSRNDKTINFETKELLPKQLLYMTLPGTTVASESKIKRGESRLLQAIRFFYEPLGLEYKEEVFILKKPDDQAVLFGIIKQI